MNIHEAKTHPSRFVEKNASDEPFVIANAGEPLVNVARVDAFDADEAAKTGIYERPVLRSR